MAPGMARFQRFQAYLYLCRTYGLGRLWRRVRGHMRSECRYIGLRRDLLEPFHPPGARVDFCVRPLEGEALSAFLLEDGEGGESLADDDLRRCRFRMAAGGLPGCHGAVTADGDLCFMQWLLTHDSNLRTRVVLGPLLPRLDADTVLLEGAYVPATMRGRGVMPAAMASIAERGRGLGARWAITFVGEDNVPSLKGARRAGFEPYTVRVERWRWGRRTVFDEPLSEVDARA